MKGLMWNGDYIATKGSTSSDGTSMFSIGGLVAFQTHRHCSPDGRQSSDGCNLMTADYLLQEEIVLESFDRTELDRFGSGSNNVQWVIELDAEFRHRSYYSKWSNYFLCQILGDATPRIGTTEGTRIEEVRGHAGQFLHIYKIGYEQWLAIETATSFEETVNLLNLREEKLAQEATERIEKKFRGMELPFGITSHGGWYEPGAGWGTGRISPAHEYDDSRTDLFVMKIAECVPDGSYHFYAGRYPVALNLGYVTQYGMEVPVEKYEPSLAVCTSSRWSNRQSWWYDEHRATNIQPGWIFIDGVDVYDATMKIVAENVAADKKARNEKFEAAKLAALEVGISEAGIVKILHLAGKGKGIVTLTRVAEMVKKGFALETVFEALQSLKGEDLVVVENYLTIAKSGVHVSHLKKVSLKAYAWSYLSNALPEIAFIGNFNDAQASIALYVKRNPATEMPVAKKTATKVAENVTEVSTSGATLGDYAWKEFEKLRKQFS